MVQDVFVTAHRRGGYREGNARPSTWLAGIARQVVATRRRTSRRRPESPDAAAIGAAEGHLASPAKVVETRDALRRVERALDMLDLDSRAIFVLFELEERPCEEIAAGLQVPLGTVYSRLHAARRKFIEAHARLMGADREGTDVAELPARKP